MSKALRQFVVVCALTCAAFGQSTGGLLLQVQNQGSLVATWKKYGVLNCGTNLTCSVSGSTVTMAASAATPTYPVTVSGTVNSGGIPYFNSTTQESSSAALTQFGVLFGGGAGGAPTSSAQGAANMPLLGNGAANPVFSAIGYPTTITASGCLVFASSTTQLACGNLIAANKLVRSGGAGVNPNAGTITDGGTANLTSDTNVFQGANTVRLLANSSAITTTTPGTAVLTFSVLPVSTNLSFTCHILYNQQTAAAAGTGFAIQGATNAPTRLDAWANMFTSQAGAQVEGAVQNLTTTTATALVSGTPSAITTVFPADIYGTIQNGASTSTLTLLAFTGNAADSITIQAGSYCYVTP